MQHSETIVRLQQMRAAVWQFVLGLHAGLSVQKDYFERSVNAAVGMHLAQSETVG